MLKELQRRIRLINYYSAPRRQTPWTRALDLGMLAAVLVAMITLWLADQIVDHKRIVFERYVRMTELEDGSLDARLLSPESKADGWGEAQPFGELTIIVADMQGGWPLPTSTTRLPPEFQLKVFAQSDIKAGEALAPGEPIREAVDRAILLEGDTEAAEAISVSRPQPSLNLTAWLFGWLMWWVILIIAWYFILQIARAGWYVVSQKSRLRARELRMENRCINCGYDMRGLEFRDRCPECGTLVS